MRLILTILICTNLCYVFAQNMGVKLPVATLPVTTLDVNGSVAFREAASSLVLSNGVNDNIALGDYSLFRITGPTAAFSITGFSSGQNGRALSIINATTQILTLTHQASSTASNQITTGGTDLTLAPQGIALLIYNTNLEKWLVSGGMGFTNIAWSLTGNSGTVDGTNFLGTIENIPLSMRVNNNQVFKFNTNSSLQRDGGGDARGISAIDLQINRSASTQAATGNYSTIGGGNNNTASGPNSTVSGGGLNNASGNGATVAGGSGNTASHIATIVAGGQTNTASGNTATVSGGVNSVASGDYSFVGGGSGNTASGSSSVVSGGTTNQASAQHATVAGGYVNKARFPFSFIGGGATDTTDANYAAVVAGYDNNSAGTASIIGAGQANRITGGSNNGILSGYRNRITNNRSGILAGQDNSVLGWNSGVLGGYGLTLGDNSVGFHAYTADVNKADVSGSSNIAYFGDVNFWLGNVTNAAKELRFYEPNTSTTYSGTNYTAFKAGIQAANITYTLPLSMATAGQLLSSDASGNLSWANTSATAWALLGNSGTTAGTDFVGTSDAQALVFKTNATEGMRLSTGQNLSIGVASPLSTARLHVENTGSNYALYAPINTNRNYFAGNTAFGGYSSNPNDISLLWGSTAVDNVIGLQKDFTSFTAGTLYRGLSTVLRLSPSSNISNLIHGLTNDIQTNASSTGNFTSLIRAVGGDFRHYGSGTVSEVEGLNAHVGNYGSGTITDAYGVQAHVFKSTGTITNAYGGQFLAWGGSTANYGLYSNPANSATNNYMYYGTMVGSTNTDWGIYLTGEDKNYFSGNVGIGCTAPQYKLHVVGDIAASGILRASSATVSTTITACSDFRFKTNITPLSNALQNVMKLQGVTYDWLKKEFPDRYFNDRKQIGIIAQELEKVYPELVNTDEKGYKSVDYSKMTPILVEAIKTQQVLIETQKKDIDDLKNQAHITQQNIDTLKKQLAQFSLQLEALAKKND